MRGHRRFQAWHMADYEQERREKREALVLIVGIGLVLLVLSSLGMPPA